eukprot:Rhum_TRINITY_DN25372_c0_g1::Rhum_TRINITY_DN25372_c0_g1_i1::g.181949::m.181949
MLCGCLFFCAAALFFLVLPFLFLLRCLLLHDSLHDAFHDLLLGGFSSRSRGVGGNLCLFRGRRVVDGGRSAALFPGRLLSRRQQVHPHLVRGVLGGDGVAALVDRVRVLVLEGVSGKEEGGVEPLLQVHSRHHLARLDVVHVQVAREPRRREEGEGGVHGDAARRARTATVLHQQDLRHHVDPEGAPRVVRKDDLRLLVRLRTEETDLNVLEELGHPVDQGPPVLRLHRVEVVPTQLHVASADEKLAVAEDARRGGEDLPLQPQRAVGQLLRTPHHLARAELVHAHLRVAPARRQAHAPLLALEEVHSARSPLNLEARHRL